MLKTFYFGLLNIINKLESRSSTLNLSLNYISKAIKEIKSVPGPIGKSVADKIKQNLARNPSYKCRTVRDID